MHASPPSKSSLSLSPGRQAAESTAPGFQVNPFKYENMPEVSSLSLKLRQSAQDLMEARAKTKDLTDVITKKRQESAKLTELHSVNQDVVVRNERELNTQRGKTSRTDAVRRREEAESTEKVLAERLLKGMHNHFKTLGDIPRENLPESHPNKVIHLMLSQIRLYQTQIDQRQEDMEVLVQRHERKLQAVGEEASVISNEAKNAAGSRLSDMKTVLKLGRTEAYTSEEIRGHGSKPTDELAAEATGEVLVKLKKKLGPSDGNVEFLRSLEDKLKRRGLNLELS